MRGRGFGRVIGARLALGNLGLGPLGPLVDPAAKQSNFFRGKPLTGRRHGDFRVQTGH